MSLESINFFTQACQVSLIHYANFTLPIASLLPCLSIMVTCCMLLSPTVFCSVLIPFKRRMCDCLRVLLGNSGTSSFSCCRSLSRISPPAAVGLMAPSEFTSKLNQSFQIHHYQIRTHIYAWYKSL